MGDVGFTGCSVIHCEYRQTLKPSHWADEHPQEDGLEKSPSGSVTLKCDRKQEAVSFPDVEPHFEGAVQLSRICHAVPIHIIWGTRNDLV